MKSMLLAGWALVMFAGSVLDGNPQTVPSAPATSQTPTLPTAAEKYIKAKMAEYKACMDIAIGMASDTNAIFNQLCKMELQAVDHEDKLDDLNSKVEDLDDLKSKVEDLDKKLDDLTEKVDGLRSGVGRVNLRLATPWWKRLWGG